MSEVVLYEVRDAVAHVTLNRPERMNALTNEMLDRLPELLLRAGGDAAVRVIVLSGSEDRAFSAGADLAGPISAGSSPSGAARSLEESIDDLKRFQEASYLLHTLPKPTIAALNGAAAGASFSMALACDFRLAVEGAVLRTAFSGIGFSGDFGGSYFLTQIVGSAQARELMMLGEKISAEEALQRGLVHRVFARDVFRKEVDAFAARLAEGPPLSYRYMKRNINLAEAGAHLREILDLEAEAMMRTGRSEDFARAVQAFFDKSKPRFDGR
jgi:2-(1,2-epoxy-1,2-dihydrophenyl)acetyl-CoA isomerase